MWSVDLSYGQPQGRGAVSWNGHSPPPPYPSRPPPPDQAPTIQDGLDRDGYGIDTWVISPLWHWKGGGVFHHPTHPSTCYSSQVSHHLHPSLSIPLWHNQSHLERDVSKHQLPASSPVLVYHRAELPGWVGGVGRPGAGIMSNRLSCPLTFVETPCDWWSGGASWALSIFDGNLRCW